jgi:DNA-binding LacI/PurR family transcriptional regulator
MESSKLVALLNLLGGDIDSIEIQDNCTAIVDGDEYKVLTDDEADDEFRQYQESLWDDLGIESFTGWARQHILTNFVDVDWFNDAMKENGLKVPHEYIAEGAYRNSIITEDIASKLLQLPKRPTCIIAPDDLSAMGVLSAIRKNGLQPVKDVSVAGYDGLDVNILVGAKLTTVKQERESIGKEAARKLIQLIENGDNIPLDTIFMKQTLIIGNSVKKLK